MPSKTKEPLILKKTVVARLREVRRDIGFLVSQSSDRHVNTRRLTREQVTERYDVYRAEEKLWREAEETLTAINQTKRYLAQMEAKVLLLVETAEEFRQRRRVDD